MESLYVATFNTQLLSPSMCILATIEFDLLDPTALPTSFDPTATCHSEDRAKAIANYITKTSPHRDRYDVIALNEVFDEDARDILVERLAGDGNTTVGPYPHYVGKLDDDTVTLPSSLSLNKLLNAEDSGLMLFSRHPFDALPKTGPVIWTPGTDNHFGAPWDNVEASSNDKVKVAFIRYAASDGEDSLAAKGAGLVRVSKDGHPYTLVFTHMQADDHEATRDSQLWAIRFMLENVLDQPSIEGDVLVLGDLNVIGGSDEWVDQFSPATLKSNFQGWDTWWQTSSQDDKGLTSNSGAGNRLDYHLYNKAEGLSVTDPIGLCPQHMRLDFYGLSDHLGITTDYIRPAPRCAPSLAWNNPPFDKYLQTDPDGHTSELKFGGSVQWFRLDSDDPKTQANESIGTFSMFAVSQPNGTTEWQLGGVSLEVYEGTDLTHPVAQYKQMTSTIHTCNGPVLSPTDCLDVEAPTYVGPTSPLYIKVFHQDPTWRGNYQLFIHKHECQNMNDSCVLRPNADLYDPQWPPTEILGDDNTAWFRIDTGKAFSDNPQELSFTMANPTGKYADLTVRDAQGKKLVGVASASDTTISGNDLASTTNDPQLLVGPDAFYLTIQRPGADANGQFVTGLKAGWKSNLNILHGITVGASGTDHEGNPQVQLLVKVEDETDGFLGNEVGSDEVGICFYADGLKVSCPLWDHEMDEGETKPVPQLPIGFTESLEVGFCEADDSSSDNCRFRWVTVLAESEEKAWSQKVGAGFEGGEWSLRYNLSRQLAV